MSRSHLSKGFTLIELMIVMSVMGAIIATAVSSFTSSQTKARDARRKNDLTQVARALELFMNDHKRYPNQSNGQVAGCGADSDSACPWGSDFTDEYGTVYIDILPQETHDGKNYQYRVSADGQKFQLFARLENLNDRAVDHNGDGGADNYNYFCGTDYCNFAVTSPNTNGYESL